MALILSAAAIHEAGHLLILRAFGVSPSAFHLSPLGAEILINRVRLSYGQELASVLAGPGANLLCGSVIVALAGNQEIAYSAAGAHFVLAVFNLLPLRPLDGGRALQVLISWRRGPMESERIGRIVGTITAILLTVFLLWLMTASGGNLWLAPMAMATAGYGCMELTSIKGDGKAKERRLFS